MDHDMNWTRHRMPFDLTELLKFFEHSWRGRLGIYHRKLVDGSASESRSFVDGQMRELHFLRRSERTILKIIA